MRTWQLAVSVLASIGAAGLAPTAAGEDPTQPVQHVACAFAGSTARVAAAAERFAPGQVLPDSSPAGGLTVDACIQNNGVVRILSADPAALHRPQSSLDGGDCFDAVRDFGGPIALGDEFALTFHWHNLTLVTVRADDGPFRDCSAAVASNTLQRALVPFHCAEHPSTMRGLVLVWLSL